MIRIVVPGEPVAQGRPKFSSQSGFFRTYDPKKSRNYKDYVRNVAKTIKRKHLFETAIVMRIDVYKQVPKSWSIKRQISADQKRIRPTGRPDVDNYAKAIKDALSGIAYTDDALVVELTVRKYYSFQPRVEIEIEPLEVYDGAGHDSSAEPDV